MNHPSAALMTTLLVTHPACLDHLNPAGHPERPDRLRAIESALADDRFQTLVRAQAPAATLDLITLCHPRDYVEEIRNANPSQGMVRLDADTSMSPGTFEAVLRAVGGAVMATDEVMAGKIHNAFCAMRPPGHHAETVRPMGFCIFNTAAIIVRHAQKKHGAERGLHDNIVNVPLRAGDGGEQFRAALETVILPRALAFRPDFVVISAGFDAHMRDPLANLNLLEPDYAWVTKKLMAIADASAKGRIVSVLEGGYDLQGLSRSVAVHVSALMEG